MSYMKRNTYRFTQVFTEKFITVRLFATQMEVAMNSLDIISQILEDKHQGYAVGTAR